MPLEGFTASQKGAFVTISGICVYHLSVAVKRTVAVWYSPDPPGSNEMPDAKTALLSSGITTSDSTKLQDANTLRAAAIIRKMRLFFMVCN